MAFLQAVDGRFFGNTLSAWIAAGVTLVLTVVVLQAARSLLVRRLTKLAERTKTDVDDFAVDLIGRTRFFFIVVLALSAATRTLVLPSAVQSAVRVITWIAILMQIGTWGGSLIAFWLELWLRRRGGDAVHATTLAAFGWIARMALWTMLVLLFIRWGLEKDITPLITGLGIGGVAVALAVQNILGDLFSSLSIVLDKPFVVGDFIIVDDYLGSIEHIGLKTTRVRSLGGEQIIFSNSDLVKARVRNYKRMLERRVVFTIGVQYDTPPDEVAAIPGIVRDIITNTPNTRFDRTHFLAWGDSSLNCEIVYWVLSPDFNVYADIHHSINLEILRRFNARGIEFAFPTRTLHVHTVSPVGGTGTEALRQP
jgi:small-conductance mechanosensitive channel